MADPTKYEVDYSFSGFQASNPSTPLPAAAVDNEFANIATSIDETVDALKDIRREDGALVNGIVTLDALAAEVADLAGADGAAATITVGTVTTGAAGSSVIITNSGTPSAAIFDITIPRGNTGAAGAGTGDMTAAVYDPTSVIGDAFDMGNMAEGSTNKIFTATERTKLTGIATSATANDTDANLRARSSHTGTQLASTISDFSTAADARITAGLGSTVQAYSAKLAAFAALTGAANKIAYFTGTSTMAVTDFTAFGISIVALADAAAARTLFGSVIGTDVQAYDAQLSSLIRQNSQSTAYTLVLTDGGKHIFHPSADTTARIWTIPANASVAFPVGTAVTFVNQNAGGVITIAITSDTMRLAGAGTTGSRSLAANGIATALKVTSTEWIISGTGLT